MATQAVSRDVAATVFSEFAPGSSAATTGGEETTYWPSLSPDPIYPTLLGNREDRPTTEYQGENPSMHEEFPLFHLGVKRSPVREVTPYFHLGNKPTHARKFQLLQQYECVVTRVDGTWFEADLRDLKAPNSPMEIAEFPLAEVSPADRPLIGPGCVFYWVIGYETLHRGQITHSSEIRVRRAPLWTQRKVDAAKARARELYTL
jgi:hypothetical protein